MAKLFYIEDEDPDGFNCFIVALSYLDAQIKWNNHVRSLLELGPACEDEELMQPSSISYLAGEDEIIL